MIDTNEIRRRIDSEGRYIGNMLPRDVLALCDEIDRLRGDHYNILMGKALCGVTPGPQGETAHVSVKVAVDRNGNVAVGEDQFQYLLEPRACYTLTATLPVPEETVVVARVEGE